MQEDHTITPLAARNARRRQNLSDARGAIAARISVLEPRKVALEEALDGLVSPWRRYRVTRLAEVMMLLFAGEVVVAAQVVQVFGLSTTFTDAIAATVAIVATALAWVAGHEWALGHDAQAIAHGRRSLFGPVVRLTMVFLLANLGTRIYFAYVGSPSGHLAGGTYIIPALEGALLTAVSAGLMFATGFVSANAETTEEVEVRGKLRKTEAELEVLERQLTMMLAGRGGIADELSA
jgi:hypothetical protein